MKHFLPRSASLLAGAYLLCLAAGCRGHESGQSSYTESLTVSPQTVVVYQDDYDYYPAFGIYYSRTHHDYVYLEGNAWVRRTEPRGIDLNALRTAPSVRMDFHDSPAIHHATVTRSYPKGWRQPAKAKTDKKTE